MNIKKNALTLAIATLLFSSQSSFADVETTATLNGVTRTMTFASQDDLDQFFNNPTNAQKAQQQLLFTNPATNLPPFDTNGLITQSLVNGVPITLTKINGGTYALVQPKEDGSNEIVTIEKPASGVLNDQGKPATVLDVVSSYSKAIADPNVTFNPTYAANVKAGATPAVLNVVKTNAQAIATSTAVPPAAFPNINAPAQVDNSPAAQVAALVAKQEAVGSLAGVDAIPPVDVPVVVNVVSGLAQQLSQDPEVKVAAATVKLDATKTVLTEVAADAGKQDLLVFAKKEVAVSADFNVNAQESLQDAVINNPTATPEQKLAALQSINDAVKEQSTAVTNYVTDSNADLQTKIALGDNLSATAESQVSLAKTLATDANASSALIEAALSNVKSVQVAQKVATQEVLSDPNASATVKETLANNLATQTAAQKDLTNTVLNSAVASDVSKLAALQSLSAALEHQNDAVSAYISDPNADFQIKSTFTTSLVAEVQSQIALAKSVTSNPNATPEQVASVLASVENVLQAQKTSVSAILTDVNATSDIKKNLSASLTDQAVGQAALVTSVASNPNASLAEKQAALDSLKEVLSTQDKALGAVTSDPNISAADKAAATASASTAAAEAVTATSTAATAIVQAATNDNTLTDAQKQAIIDAANQTKTDVAASAGSIDQGGTPILPGAIAGADLTAATDTYSSTNTQFTGSATARADALAAAGNTLTAETAKASANNSVITATQSALGGALSLADALGNFRSIKGLQTFGDIAAVQSSLQSIKAGIDAQLADLNTAQTNAAKVLVDTDANQAQKDAANALLVQIAALKTNVTAAQTDVQSKLADITGLSATVAQETALADQLQSQVGQVILDTVLTPNQTQLAALSVTDKQYLLTELDSGIASTATGLAAVTADQATAELTKLDQLLKAQTLAAKEYAKVPNADQTLLTDAVAKANATKTALTTALALPAFSGVSTELKTALNTDVLASINDISALTDPALADLQLAATKLSDTASAKSALEGSSAFVAAKKALADPTALKANDIVSLRENALKNNFMGQVHDAEALLAKALKEGGQSDAAKAQIAQIKQGIAALKASDAVQLYDKTGSLDYYVENTATNGVAGNPSSAMNLMVDGMFNQIANVGNGSTANIAASSDNGIKHSFDVGLNYNYFNLHGTSVNNVNLTPSFSTKFDSKGQLILTLPLSYISGQVSNLDSYQVGTGIAYKYDVTDNWSITPAFNYAYRMVSNGNTPTFLDKYNALTLGDGTSMYGGSLTNKFNFKWSGINVGFTNMNGYFENIGGMDNNALGYTGVSGYGNDISNYVLKNGISFGKKVAGYDASTYLTDTEYFSVGGSKNVFFDQISEFGFAVKPESFGSNLNVSAGYMFSYKSGPKGDLDGFKLNVNYKFD